MQRIGASHGLQNVTVVTRVDVVIIAKFLRIGIVGPSPKNRYILHIQTNNYQFSAVPLDGTHYRLTVRNDNDKFNSPRYFIEPQSYVTTRCQWPEDAERKILQIIPSLCKSGNSAGATKLWQTRYAALGKFYAILLYLMVF